MATDTKDRAVREARDKFPIPKKIKERLERGEERKNDRKVENEEITEFWRGNQFVARHPKGYLYQQDTVTNFVDGSGKPPHRMRQVINLIMDVVAHEVSASTQRIPSFEITPSTTDDEDVTAAKLAERVALYGYDKWNLRDVASRVVTLAVLHGEGFAWPFFDNQVGPFITDENGETLAGMGEVRVRVFSANQTAWEPGQRFEESQWWTVEQALPEEQVRQMDGFLGGPLVEDADVQTFLRARDQAAQAKLVSVIEYLERPCPEYPAGRWITVANNRVIAGIYEDGSVRPYPAENGEGKIVDEPVLHKLSYFVDPDSDRDMGLCRHLIDPQRTINDAYNKLLEWKNLALIPQVFVTPGLMKRQRLTDEPGAIYEIPQPDQNVKWRDTPQVPAELFQIMEQAKQDMARISAQNQIPSQVESAKGIQALLESDASRRADFVHSLADWWSGVMRHCLYLVQKHYREEDGRLLKLQGRFGPELISGFRGADLRGNADVRVLPGSIEPRTKAAIEAKILAFADRGWIDPHSAMAAINGGTAEKLAESYELDVARANRIIRRITEGPEALFDGREQVVATDPMTGMPQTAPNWMPHQGDNVPVWKTVFQDFFKTQEYESLEPGMQEAAQQIYSQLQMLEAEQVAREMAMQTQMAEQLGMANAASPQDKGMPDAPSATEGGPPTMNQPPGQSGPTQT